MRISDWSSDVCSSDLFVAHLEPRAQCSHAAIAGGDHERACDVVRHLEHRLPVLECDLASLAAVAHLQRGLGVEDDARAVGKPLGTLFTKVCGVSHSW